MSSQRCSFRSRRLRAAFFGFAISSLLGASCVSAATPAAEIADAGASERETLTQWSTIDALLKGYYEGVASVGELKRHGDFGLGTFQSLDGEMAVLDGTVFQIGVDGTVREVGDDVRTPFAAVTFFEADLTLSVEAGLDLAALQARIDAALPSRNLFYAIRVTGSFDSVKTRSVPRQAKPWRPLAEVVKTQTLFQIEETRGILIGLWAPAGVKSLNVPGYHFHYLDDARASGGHVLGLVTGEGVRVEIDVTRGFRMQLPEGATFDALDLAGDRSAELHAVESDRK